MECVYHAVPPEMAGTVLVPLSELAGLSLKAFEHQRSKYREREAVLDARITADGLRFNDTVHCAPLHPHHLYRLHNCKLHWHAHHKYHQFHRYQLPTHRQLK